MGVAKSLPFNQNGDDSLPHFLKIGLIHNRYHHICALNIVC